jgi:hypothetical protein
VNTFKLRIKELENVKATKQWIKMKFTWEQKDCIIMKESFTAIKPKSNKVRIFTLKDDIKVIITSQIKMEEICYNFYIKLYKTQKDHFGNEKL